MNEAFVVEQLHTAFGIDGLADTHALSQEVNTPAEISVMFDQVTYNKGASVIRMLQHAIGNDSFVNGLRVYLKDRLVSNKFHWAPIRNECIIFSSLLAICQELSIRPYQLICTKHYSQQPPTESMLRNL